MHETLADWRRVIVCFMLVTMIHFLGPYLVATYRNYKDCVSVRWECCCCDEVVLGDFGRRTPEVLVPHDGSDQSKQAIKHLPLAFDDRAQWTM